MLNAKEKAKEIVESYKYRDVRDLLRKTGFTIERMSLSLAKQCAIICVDKLIEIYDILGYDEEDTEIVYLEEVKNQINLC